MKSKVLMAAAVLSVTAFSFSAFSQEKTSFCEKPLEKICGETQAQRNQRDLYIKDLKKEIAAEARITAAPRIEQMKKEIPKYRFIRRYVQELKISNQEIMKSAQKRIDNIESVVTNPENLVLLKNYMLKAIDESTFNDTTKANFKATIGSVVIGNFADFLERREIEDSLIGQLTNPCGVDGMVANAFATTVNKEKYVLICPGFLITLSQTANDKEKFESMLLAITHEMGHHIDNSVAGNEIYRPYLSCIAQNYSDKFNITAEDQKYCKKNGLEACKAKVTISHAGEMIADAWGIKVLSIHARTQNYSYADAEQLMTSSWANLCGTDDEGIHPSGNFRIEVLLRKNPDITNYLGCSNQEVMTKPACTLGGAVNI